MTAAGASDLHLKPGRAPLMRVDGDITEMEAEVLTPESIGQMLSAILQPHQKARLEKDLSVDLGYGVPGLARFRCNIYLQRGTLAASFRLIPYEILTVDNLNLPPVLLDLCNVPMGMVLVTGPTGSGKSTSLAAILKHITATRPVNIITIEDPMEFLMGDSLATVSQREVGTDTPNFAEALRNAMRQDPDVIMVGEMRDPETVSTVISAAETGHLVFSTLHTNSAHQTVDRILDTFPAEQQSQVRSQLSQVLAAVVSMKLVQKRDGGRVAALEILRNSPKVSKLIEQGKTTELKEEIESSVSLFKMQTMNQSLISLLVHGDITYKTAIERSPDPDDLSLKLRNMFPNIEAAARVEMETGVEAKVDEGSFGEIRELRKFKDMFEESDKSMKVEIKAKEGEIARLVKVVADRDKELETLQSRVDQQRAAIDKIHGDHGRLKQEAQSKVDRLMDHIKELNTRLAGAAR